MATRIPLVVNDGQIQQLQSGDTIAATGYPIPYGFSMQWVSGYGVTVTAGKANDSTGAALLTLTAASTSVSINTNASINGNDRQTAAGLVATTASSSTVTGTSTSFLTQFNQYAGTGTITTSGTAGSGGSNFRSQVKVGDLVGTATLGYSRVTAVAADDASFTLAAALPNGNASAVAFNIIQNLIISLSQPVTTAYRVNTITSDTVLAVETTYATSSSGGGLYYGGFYNYGSGGNVPYYLHIVNGTSGTGFVISTQRTTPYGVAGYNTYFRRIGSVMVSGAANQIIEFDQTGQANERRYNFECASGTNGTNVVNGVAANTAWQSVVASGCVPATAKSLVLNLNINGPSAIIACYLRKRGAGNAATSRNVAGIASAANGYDYSQYVVPCDDAQGFDWCTSGTSTGAPIIVYASGYTEDLNN